MKTFSVLICSLLLTQQGFSAQDSAHQYYENALLYREFHRAAVQLEHDYYNWLLTRGNEPQHHYAHYYAGVTSAEMENWQAAAESFKRFSEIPGIRKEDKATAEIQMGLCVYQQGKTDHPKAFKLWKKYDTSKNRELRSALGYAYARANIHLDAALSLCQGQIETDASKRNLGYVHLRRGDLEAARTLLESIDFKTAERVFKGNRAVPETGERIEEFHFFHPAPLSHLSELYLTLAANTEPTLENAFAVGMSRYELGRYDEASSAFSSIQRDDFAAGRQKLESIIHSLTWWSGERKRAWMDKLVPKLEARDTGAITAALIQLVAQIQFSRRELRRFTPTQNSRRMRSRIEYVAKVIFKSEPDQKAKKNWLSERGKELKAGNISAIVAAVAAMDSAYGNAEQVIEAGERYFLHAIAGPVWMGACYLKLGDTDQALKIWSLRRAQYATNPDFWSELGLAFSELGDSDHTRESAASLLESTDTNDPSRAFCERALMLAGYAPDDIESSVVVTKDLRYFRNLGRVFARSGDAEGALLALKKGRDVDAWNSLEANGALFFAQIAQSYYPFKEFTEVLLLWLKLAEAYPASYQIHDTARLISLIYGKGRGGVSHK